MTYSGRVLVGFWLDKLLLDSERRQRLEEKRARGELPHQREERLRRAFLEPVGPMLAATAAAEEGPADDAAPVRYGRSLLLQAPEARDLSHLYEGATGCPDEPTPRGPRGLGLYLAATCSALDLDAAAGQLRGIEDGCPLVCSPRRVPTASNVFAIKPARAAGRRVDVVPDGEPLRFGQHFYIQMVQADQILYVRSETPLIDGVYGPNDHNPLRLNLNGDSYAKWRAVHWNKHKRFETEGTPILACMRVVIQHVMTGKCLAVENFKWHCSLLGFECGVSVHIYNDVHRNETYECIWNFVVEESSVENHKNTTPHP